MDDPVRFSGILQGLENLAEEFDMPVLYPNIRVHEDKGEGSPV